MTQVVILLAVMAVLFATDKIRADFIALAALSYLMLAGILTPAEGFASFGNPTVIMIALLFIVGEGLVRSGLTMRLGEWMSRRIRPGDSYRLTAFTMLNASALSGMMSSTGVVAIFIPVVQSMCTRLRIDPRRILLPLAYAGLIGGLFTLIATAPNLVISEELTKKGYEPLGFLAVTPFGVAILGVALAWFYLRDRLAGRREGRGAEAAPEAPDDFRQLLAKYRVERQLSRLRLLPASPLAGLTVRESGIRSRYGVEVIGIERPERFFASLTPVIPDTKLLAGDILFVHAAPEITAAFAAGAGLEITPLEERHLNSLRENVGLVELVVLPDSRLVNRVITEIGGTDIRDITVLGVTDHARRPVDDFRTHKLRPGDALLAWGAWEKLRRLRRERRNVMVLNMPWEKDYLNTDFRKLPFALLITALMVLLLITELLPPVLTILLTALLFLGGRFLSMEEAYRSVSWSTVVLIAAMMPFGFALEKTGGVQLFVDGILGLFGRESPRFVFTGLFFLTAALSLFISNTATAILVAPIAIQLAEAMGLSPYPFCLGVAVAASSAFSTPVASPVNMLVVSPGRYAFLDFVRAGVPLTLLSFLISLWLAPRLFPFIP